MAIPFALDSKLRLRYKRGPAKNHTSASDIRSGQHEMPVQKPRLTVRVERDDKTALERYAILARGKTVSDVVRDHLAPLFQAARQFAKKSEAKQ